MANMADTPDIVVAHSEAGERLDRYLRRHVGHLSRTALSQAIGNMSVLVNGRRATKGQLLRTGDRIRIEVRDRGPGPGVDAALPLRILYEDADVVAIDKPAGIPSHALRPGEVGTVVSALLNRYPDMAGVGYRPLEPGILHRLDTETSGVLVAARNPTSFQALRLSQRRGEMPKRYVALCWGHLDPGRKTAYLRANQRRVRVEPAAFSGARPIETEVIAAAVRGGLCLVTIQLASAARHQVRAHLAALGHPIVADALYGGASAAGLTRHFLHASDVAIRHPAHGQLLEFHADLPDDLVRTLEALPAHHGS